MSKEEREKKVFLDGFGYLYWGNEKLGFSSQIFRDGGLLNTQKDKLAEEFEEIEKNGGKVTISDAERIYKDLPKY